MNPIFNGHLDQNQQRLVTGELRVLLCVLSNGDRVKLEPTLNSVCRLQPPIQCDVRLLVIEHSRFARVGDMVEAQRRRPHSFSTFDFALMPNPRPHADVNRGIGESRLQMADVVLFLREGTHCPPEWLGVMLEKYRSFKPAAILGPVLLDATTAENTSLEQSIQRRAQRQRLEAGQQPLDPFGHCLLDGQVLRQVDYRINSDHFLDSAPWRSKTLWQPDTPVFECHGRTGLSLQAHYRRSRRVAMAQQENTGLVSAIGHFGVAFALLLALPFRPVWHLTLLVERLGLAKGSLAQNETHPDPMIESTP